MKYPHLFSPLKLGDVIVQNRIVANPMSGYLPDRCHSGAGIVICGHTIVEPGRSSWESPDEPYAFSKYEREATRRRARMAQQGGSLASIELAHAGHYARTHDFAMGPDGFIRNDGVEVKAMTPSMMEHTASCWANACADAKRAGFDMVFLHFGHGWLMGQFLSPLFNHRSDEYGGAIANRMKFPLQTLEACRKAVGPMFPIEMRVSATECMPGGIELQDVLAFCKEAQRYVTSIQVSCGLDIIREANVHTSATAFDPHLLNAELAKAIKQAVNIPVTLVGSIETPAEAEEAIAQGTCDMVALARALAADPEWPDKARRGLDAEIVPCLRCLQCYHIGTDRWDVACSVNPRYANEDFVPKECLPAKPSKQVLIVGAGPAGCRAAIEAVKRGHTVVLAERSAEIGGKLNLIAKEAHKQDVARYLDYLNNQINALAKQGHLELRLNTDVTPSLVKEMKPEALIVAIGAQAATPPLKGIDLPNVISFVDAINNPQEVGKEVVVIGGGTIGSELTLEFAELGKHVSVIEMGPKLAAQGNDLYRIALRQMFAKHEPLIEVLTETSCKEIQKECVIVEDKDGKLSKLKYDTAVISTGLRANREAVEALCGIANQTLLAGDCRRPRIIKDATFEGYCAATAL